MRDAADMFAPFDDAMAEIYAARSGLEVAEVSKMMDAETFINAREALAKGFADSTYEVVPRCRFSSPALAGEGGRKRRKGG